MRSKSPVGLTKPGKAPARSWMGLGVIALPCILVSMDMTVLNLAVPHLAADLGPSAAELLWIVDIYGFMVAGALMTMGTVGDRIGRRRLLLIGAAFFGAASAMAAFASSPFNSSRRGRFWALPQLLWRPPRSRSSATCSRTMASGVSRSACGLQASPPGPR